MLVIERYQAELAQRGYEADAAQLSAVNRLGELSQALGGFVQSKRGIKSWFGKTKPPKGVWLWGGVGRGKSFIMDCFYTSVMMPDKGPEKLRIHFHEFMRSVHRELDAIKGQKNPLQVLGKRLAQQYSLICFDEFHVSDIADAMILERLLQPLFDGGVVFVMTSNYVPDKLYPEGLHRDRILPAIALLNSHLDIVNVDAGVDYRKTTLSKIPAYLTPDNEANQQILTKSFNALAEMHDEEPELHIENRLVHCLRKAGGVVWFDFETLCNGPRSQNDYLELASRFHTVFLSGVPHMSAGMASAARRFTWLVDVLYDQKVKLIISAKVPETELYTAGAMAGEFQRTVSRLVEMRSEQYLDAPRRGVVSF